MLKKWIKKNELERLIDFLIIKKKVIRLKEYCLEEFIGCRINSNKFPYCEGRIGDISNSNGQIHYNCIHDGVYPMTKSESLMIRKCGILDPITDHQVFNIITHTGEVITKSMYMDLFM